jgi:hypothetical protein
MDIDLLLLHYFDSPDPDEIAPLRLAAGKQRLTLDFAVEREPGRRFALWTLMEVFGIAPPPAQAFKDPALRRAAEDYLTAARRLEEEEKEE